MSAYIREDSEIPDPSDHSSGEEDDVSFLPDLLHPENQTSQEDVTDEKTEEDKIAQLNTNAEVLDPIKKITLPGRTNIIVSSEDGQYLFLGHKHGLSVIRTETLTSVTSWQAAKVEITSISCTSLRNDAYLLSTVDDMGIARLFLHHTENIHLIKAINETDDINHRHMCLKFDVSQRGDFGAAVMMFKESIWLDVFRFPCEIWLKDLDTKQSTHSVSPSENKLSSVVFLMKVRPTEIPPGTQVKSPFEVLEKTEQGTTIGSGQYHLITSSQWENHMLAYRNKYGNPPGSEKTQETTRNGTCHFLLRDGCSSGEAKSARDNHPSFCVWWNGSRNLLQYVLKAPKEKDGEPRPDVLWPNSECILTSVVSFCTRFIVLALQNQLITVWDRRFGLPYANIRIPGDGAICKMRLSLFASGQQDQNLFPGPVVPAVQLLVTFRNGECYSVSLDSRTDPKIVALIERPTEPDIFVTVAEPVLFMNSLALLIQRNGKVSLCKLDDGSPVFNLNLPKNHVLGSLWDPVTLLDPFQQTICVRGDMKTTMHNKSRRDECGDENRSSLFIFSQFPEMNSYHIPEPVSASGKETKATLTSLDEACNVYFQQRFHSLDERSQNFDFHWEQLGKLNLK